MPHNATAMQPKHMKKGDRPDISKDTYRHVSAGGSVRVRPGMRKALEETRPNRLSMTQWVVTLLEAGMVKNGILPKDYRY
jgi:hypothetical protein